MDEQTADIHWTTQLERVLADEGERALCFSWLHLHSEKMFTELNTRITIPVIVMSTVAGSASIGSQGLFPDSHFAGLAIGLVSLTVAILNTLASFFAWAKRSESHRIASITYQKVYRFILIELALPRNERMAARDMLKIVREQCDRLNEMSPQIPDRIILHFKNRFETTTELKKPEITNGLDPIEVFSYDIQSPKRYGFPVVKAVDPGTLQASAQTINLPITPKTSNDDRIPNNLQTLSSVHLPNESASDSNRTSFSSCKTSTT